MMMVPILLFLFLCGYEVNAAIQLPGGHKIKAFEGTTTTVLVSFTTADHEFLSAVINSDINIIINGTINTLHKNGSVDITPSDINTLNFGTYRIEFHLYNNNYSEQVAAALFYEKSLSGLTIKNDVVETLVNRETQFGATLTSGSSAVVEWISNFDSLVTYGVCNGSMETIETNMIFPSSQNYTLTVLVVNSLGQNLSAQIDVIVWKPVEGFSFTILPTVASVNEEITFTILLDNNNRLPMGNIIFNISFGDGNSAVNSDNVASDLTANGIIFKHTYDQQGNYSITSYAYTSLSETKFSRTAFVWSNISLPTAVSYIEIKQNGLFLSDYITTTPFMYYIAYGDNRNKTSSPDIITNNQPLTISEWDNSYQSEGIYEIEFEAWNPFYTEKCKYIVKVQNPVPLLTLLPLEMTPLSLFPAIQSGVNFTLNMTNENSLPPTNMTCKFCFDSSTCSADKDVDFSSVNFYMINHVYTDTGEMNISVNCSNNVSHGMVNTRIEMLPGIQGFKVTNGYVLSLPTNNSTTSEFSYSQGTLMSTVIKVHADDIISITGTVNENTKSGFVTIKEDNLQGVIYGSYKVTLELHSVSGEIHEIILALFYEEPISGFQVQEEADLVLVKMVTSFNVQFTTGSNVEVEIVIRDTESVLVSCEGTERVNQVTYKYIDAVDYTINSVARNTITSSNTEYTKVKTVKPIKGFDLNVAIDLIDSYTNASLNIKLDNSSRLPMHNLTLNLDYGDHLNSSISFNGHLTNQALTSGYVISHEYTRQGNYTVKGIMMSSLSSQTMEHAVYVWDNITNLRLTSNRSAVVNEIITFSFINVPRCGFEYKIEYGDGDGEQSQSDILYGDYTEITFTHSYFSPEVYEVNVTLWNPFFKVFHKYLIIIQHPIVDFYLSPQPPIQYPIPDGKVIFTINMTNYNPDPTNVTCQFSYEKGDVFSNDSVDIIYTKDVMRIYNYTTSGTKDVVINCSNVVSSVILTTQIDIKKVELDDFTFFYPHVVPMNMTSDATDISVSVEFIIALFDCVRFPPEVEFKWNFNDSSVDTTQSSSIIHSFVERRRYEILIEIYNNSEKTTKTLDIKIGAVDFDVSSYLGGVGITNFTFFMTGIGMYGYYKLFPGVDDSSIIKQQPNENEYVNIYKVYNDWGKFNPRIIARNENFTEFLYFPEPVVVDYNMSVMQIDMPKTLKMPNPGKVNVTAFLVGTTIPLPFTSCTYDMQDFIDFSVVTLTQNITTSSPLIYTFEYLTLGEHEVTINCSNYFDTFFYQSTITVTNKCFTIEGIFDRQYARPTTPMIVYTTENFDLANRMGVHCSNQTITFNWDVYSIITIKPETKQRIHNTGNEADQTNRGAYRFSKGKFQEGLYEIFLNVSLSTTWIPERTYLRFVRPAPIAFIEGGFQRTSKLSNTFLTIDALTSSYDIGLGYGGNADLNFTWTCYRINASDLDDLAKKYEEHDYGDTPCIINETSRGIANLTFEEGIQQGYIVTVNVTLDKVFAKYTQLTMTANGSNPDIYIRCKLNCDSKYAVSAHSIWEVVCIDCVSTPTYMWKLKFQNNDQDWLDVSNIKTKTGRTKQSFDIEDFSLEQGKTYRIEVSVTDLNGVGEAKWSFFTNQFPYGGVCKAVNHTILGRPPTVDEIEETSVPVGKAFSTKFAIYCFDWKDEADRKEKNEIKDSKEPLMYEYIIVQYNKGSNDLDLSTNTSIYKGGESTATDLRLPAGSPDFDYAVGLYVKITDRFGDYSTKNWTVNVTRDESLEPTNVDGANKLFGEYDDSYNITKAGGNDIAVLRLIASTASMYSNILLSNKSATTTNEEDLIAIEEDTIDDVQTLVREKTNEFVTEISKLVPVNSTIKMLPSDAHLVASTLDECISNQDAITQSASEGITNTTYELMLNIQNASKSNPIPMQELNAIKGGALDVIDVVSKNLKFLENTTIEDLNTTLTLEQVESDLRDYLLFHPEERTKYPINTETIQAMYEKRMKIREKQIEIGNSTEKTTGKLFGCIDTVNEVNSINVAYGQGPYEIRSANLQLTIEKDSVSNLINKTKLHRNGFTFDMENGTFTNITDENVEIQVSVLETSPMIHAGGATNIHGKIVRLTARNDEGKEIHFPIPMTIENEGITHYAEFDTSIFDDEHNGLMHFRVHLQDDSDALIAYILPEGFDEYTTETYNLTVYATSKISSTVGEYAFEEAVSPLSWTTFGFKVFIPSGTFPKGDIVLSLKRKEVPRNTSETDGLSRRRRSVDPVNPLNQTFTNVSVAIVTTGCRVYDESSNTWTPNGCSVLSFSTLNETLCRCEAGAGNVFASSFFVPNMIDFHSVWSKFDVNNAAIYGTLIALFVLYIGGMVYLRRKDKIDQIKWMPVLLCDNQKSAEYFYLISVYTGLRPGSGTKSNVSFILGGEDGDSGVRLLNDGTSEGIQSKTVKSYIMATPDCLGGLTYVRVWHDNSGENDDASWYLHQIVVEDIQTKEKFVFLSDRWLALDLDDGMIDRLLPVLDKDNAGFESVFSQQTRLNISENHLWLSIVVRPQRSLFTRVQRLSCLMSLLLLTMITNAMFFQTESEETVIADTVRIGKLRLSLKTAYISVVGVLITVVPIMIITYLFKNTRVKKKIVKDGKPDKTVIKSREITMEEEAKYPFWVVYIAWTIVALSILVPAFFMLLYSMEWGTDKSEEWLTTFVLSFVESLFIVDPLKVLIIALIIAWLIKKPADDINLKIDLDSVREQCKNSTENNSKQFLSFRMEVMSKSGPPVEDALQHQRIKRMKEKIAQQAFIEVILQILFAAVIFSISYVNRDDRFYRQKASIDNYLYACSKSQFGFSKVLSQEAFANWTKQTLIPFTYPTEKYNGKGISAHDKYYVADMDNVRVGQVRLRQVRTNKDDCVFGDLTGSRVCVPAYNTDKENKSFMVPIGPISSYTSNAWKYTGADEIWGISITGLYNTYGGGGFIQNFHKEKVLTINAIEELTANKWIDRFTRAVFVEFTLFNPNLNLFSYTIYLAEFSENGGAYNWIDTQSFRATTITDATGAFSIILYIIYLIIIIVLTYKLIKKFRLQGCRKTFTNFWNGLDIVLCILSYAATVVWIFKYIYTRKAMKQFNENRDAFINFQHIVVWEYIFTCILGGLCFAATLRILSALKYNKKLTEVAEVLRKGANPICQFAVMFMCVFFNFVGFGYLLFGSTVREYRNMFIAFGSLTNTLIGRNSLDSMISASPAFAELYFFVYVFFVIFTLMTMFSAILNESISEVRYAQAADTIGIMQLVKTTVKDILSLVGLHFSSGTSKRTNDSHRGRQKYNNDIDTSNVLGLIRETLGDFKSDDEQVKPKDSLAAQEDGGNKDVSAKLDLRPESRPLTAQSVKIILPDGTEAKDNEGFYEFYKGYL
ncbi:uncharacterized protein LOC127710241 [Mytilus californianus]|uniref:uncharacterized protein LOC127710241 n=1 Tax=Mytilus californianus TaxID=6549 RepID=UPI002247281A|nr:uncharacterized protein LOC127710241 [Mytilus californianus]